MTRRSPKEVAAGIKTLPVRDDDFIRYDSRVCPQDVSEAEMTETFGAARGRADACGERCPEGAPDTAGL